ncbi:MAG: YkgJ family cysteine cluster protein [Flavobacteriales bacterium]|nr:YkgJ family cysteine cluster protein [Flavobacteriales bacterium]
MSDSSNICLSCGLCCDGTLIGFVQVERKEIPMLKGLLNIEEDSTGDGVFLHPCNNYCDGCTIYSKRPKQCAKFNCGLVTSLEQKELDFNSAIEIINTVKQKKIAIEKMLVILHIKLKSPSFYFKMVELKKILEKKKSESSLTPDHLALISDLDQLDSLLPTKFNISAY